MSLIYLARLAEESQENKSYTGYVGPDDITGENRSLVCVGTEEAKTPRGVVVVMRLSPRESRSPDVVSAPMFRQTMGWKFLFEEGWKQVSYDEAGKLLGRAAKK